MSSIEFDVGFGLIEQKESFFLINLFGYLLFCHISPSKLDVKQLLGETANRHLKNDDGPN